MPDQRISIPTATVWNAVSAAGFIVATLIAFDIAVAQAPPQAQPAAPVAPASPDATAPEPKPPEPAANSGLINEIGKLLRAPADIFSIPSPRETFDGLNARAKGATDSLGRLARPNVASGRVVCVVAPNGAPDCKAAADKLCQSKGFSSGNSIESDAAESCPARVLLSGRPPEPGECRTDNFVTRALCQ